MFYVYSHRDVELTPRSASPFRRLKNFMRRASAPAAPSASNPETALIDLKAAALEMRRAAGMAEEAEDGAYTYLRKKRA